MAGTQRSGTQKIGDVAPADLIALGKSRTWTADEVGASATLRFDAHLVPFPSSSGPLLVPASPVPLEGPVPPSPPPRPLADPAAPPPLRTAVSGRSTGSLARTSSPGDAADCSSRTPPGIRIQRTLFASRNVRMVSERASLDVKSCSP